MRSVEIERSSDEGCEGTSELRGTSRGAPNDRLARFGALGIGVVSERSVPGEVVVPGEFVSNEGSSDCSSVSGLGRIGGGR